MAANTTAAAVAGAAAGGYLLGMPIEAVVLGALASAAMVFRSEKRNTLMVLSSIMIGGLLGGAIAPPLAHWVLEHQWIGERAAQNFDIVKVSAPVFIGIVWQLVGSVLADLYPSIERQFDRITDFIVGIFVKDKDK